MAMILKAQRMMTQRGDVKFTVTVQVSLSEVLSSEGKLRDDIGEAVLKAVQALGYE